MPTIGEFVNRWQGQRCCTAPDCTQGNFCECVALANQWACENGWPTPQGSTAATLTWPQGWSKEATPRAGDLLVWQSTLPGSGGAGHIALAVDPSGWPNQCQTLDQNWGTNDPPPQLVMHSSDLQYLEAIWRYGAGTGTGGTTHMLTLSEKRAYIRAWFNSGLGRPPATVQELDSWATLIQDDGSNCDAIISSIYGSAEGNAWLARLQAAVNAGLPNHTHTVTGIPNSGVTIKTSGPQGG